MTLFGHSRGCHCNRLPLYHYFTLQVDGGGFNDRNEPHRKSTSSLGRSESYKRSKGRYLCDVRKIFGFLDPLVLIWFRPGLWRNLVQGTKFLQFRPFLGTWTELSSNFEDILLIRKELWTEKFQQFHWIFGTGTELSSNLKGTLTTLILG